MTWKVRALLQRIHNGSTGNLTTFQTAHAIAYRSHSKIAKACGSDSDKISVLICFSECTTVGKMYKFYSHFFCHRQRPLSGFCHIKIFIGKAQNISRVDRVGT